MDVIIVYDNPNDAKFLFSLTRQLNEIFVKNYKFTGLDPRYTDREEFKGKTVVYIINFTTSQLVDLKQIEYLVDAIGDKNKFIAITASFYGTKLKETFDANFYVTENGFLSEENDEIFENNEESIRILRQFFEYASHGKKADRKDLWELTGKETNFEQLLVLHRRWVNGELGKYEHFSGYSTDDLLDVKIDDWMIFLRDISNNFDLITMDSQSGKCESFFEEPPKNVLDKVKEFIESNNIKLEREPSVGAEKERSYVFFITRSIYMDYFKRYFDTHPGLPVVLTTFPQSKQFAPELTNGEWEEYYGRKIIGLTKAVYPVGSSSFEYVSQRLPLDAPFNINKDFYIPPGVKIEGLSDLSFCQFTDKNWCESKNLIKTVKEVLQWTKEQIANETAKIEPPKSETAKSKTVKPKKDKKKAERARPVEITSTIAELPIIPGELPDITTLTITSKINFDPSPKEFKNGIPLYFSMQ
jgi:hypothetical protein